MPGLLKHVGVGSVDWVGRGTWSPRNCFLRKQCKVLIRDAQTTNAMNYKTLSIHFFLSDTSKENET